MKKASDIKKVRKTKKHSCGIMFDYLHIFL